MSENKEHQDQSGLEQSTYEIIRDRLNKHGVALKSRLETLNNERKEVFGATETQLITTEHISTEHACEARDMVPVGNRFIFGYNVHIGLKSEVNVEDVFNVYSYVDQKFKNGDSAVLQDEQFIADFKNLYKYYKQAKFSQFISKNGFLYFVFQIGKETSDIKTFKWSVNADFSLTYLDSRSEHEVRLPEQYAFDWIRPSQDHFRNGAHPHISIEDKIFVETIGGDLTIKIEDNTDSGMGIYDEPVEHSDQSLSDAEVEYAIVGDIIVLKILPYQEKEHRFIVYSHKTKQARRIDALNQSCVLLPEDHGIIFPQGYFLQSGDYKLFDFEFEGMRFEKAIPSPNGEDFLYVFYNASKGLYTLFIYNLIEQRLAQPIHCNGYSLFNSGEMCLFRTDSEAKRHHGIQIWITPFAHADHLKTAQKEAYLFKIGNKEVVSAMAECRTVIKLIERDDSYATIYVDLSKTSQGILDAYHWVSKEEAGNLAKPLQQIQQTAQSAISEFDKVLRLKKSAETRVSELNEKMIVTRQSAKSARYDTIDRYVETLTLLRGLRGELISAKEIRYIATDHLDQMEEEILELQDSYSNACVEFLLTDSALEPYEVKVNEIEERLSSIKKVVEADELDRDISTVSNELELLIEIVNSLNIEDSTVTTKIIDNITSIFYRFNRIIADLKKARKSIFGAEAESEFKSQLKLIQQGASNYINLSDTPEKCEDYLNRLIIQLEELEGKFSDFPEFSMPITEVREEIHNAFETHKLGLIEQRNNRSVSIQKSTERILIGIKSRLEKFGNQDEINAYLASDMLVQKVRDNIEKLLALDDSAKADELKSQLKSVRETALRQLRDKNELFADGDDIIKLGEHLFSVNKKNLDVTLVKREDAMHFHLTGTSFFHEIEDEAFNATRDLWSQALVSENDEIYRAEYLAYLIYQEFTNNLEVSIGEEVYTLETINNLIDKELSILVQKFMAGRYEERYVKGVHDMDAARILKTLLQIRNQADLLTFSPVIRASARYFWLYELNDGQRDQWSKRLKAYGLMNQAFDEAIIPEEVHNELKALIEDSTASNYANEEAHYLFLELSSNDGFVFSPEARELKESFGNWLKTAKLEKRLLSALDALAETPRFQLQLIREWLKSHSRSKTLASLVAFIDEAAVSVLRNKSIEERAIEAHTSVQVNELIGEHKTISDDSSITIDYTAWNERLKCFATERVPAYEKYQGFKHSLIENFKEDMKLESFQPKIMTSFVRNKLIDEVYLKLIGNNLAKQIGVAGEEKRTDLMGMLLLISPPGYGKTTLMEYIAQRVGLIFVKINGPALGHSVTSVDPESAPNSAAKEELKKLNLSFEMGDNVMIYIDDIQHCHPEFLQKFISLCDGQRKIEGVYNGRSKTYDFRGRKVMVVMAGNPYTESGERFQIPDMLANRSDIYNLGDVIGGKQEVFELSYIENCLTSNSILARLNNKSFKDVYEFIRAAGDNDNALNLEAQYSAEEVEDYVNLLKRVIAVKDIVFKVNLEYIKSASTEDAYRTAPSFKLQGSYRDMNKIVEKLVPVMNDEELQTLILSHYENESQTLTSSAESSLLRFKEIYGVMTTEEKERWSDMKAKFQRNQKLHGVGESNEMAHVISQMESISEALKGIGTSIDEAKE